MVERYLRGDRLVDVDDPVELFDVLDRLIRLQAVKCSPHDGAVSEPSGAMWDHCPPMLLADELRLARPGAVTAFGASMPWAFEQLGGFVSEGAGDRLRWGTLRLKYPIPVFFLDHPRYGGWARGQASLLRLLRRLRRRPAG